MSAKNTYFSLLNSRDESLELAKNNQKDLEDFVKSRLNSLHRVGKSVLIKCAGRHDDLTDQNRQVVETDLNWLSAYSLKIVEIDSFRIVFEASYYLNSSIGKFQIDKDIIHMSDRDFAKKVRSSRNNVKASKTADLKANNEKRIFDLRKSVVEMEKRLNRAKKELEKNTN